MTLQEKKEMLNAKKKEIIALKDGIEAGDTEAIAKASEIANAINELETSVTEEAQKHDLIGTCNMIMFLRDKMDYID